MRNDEPIAFWPRVAKFYAVRAWMNIPLGLLALPFLLAGTLVRGWWIRRNRRPEKDCNGWKVVCVSHVPWDHVWQRNHHTMSRLAERGHPVLYMRPVYLHVVARWPTWVIHDPANPVPPGVVSLNPAMIPGGSRYEWIDRLNAWLLESEALYRGFSKDVLLWFYYPAHERLRDRLAHRACVYDIQDEYSAFEWASQSVRDAEVRLLDTADVTFPGTYALYVRKKPSNGNSHFFACGVDVDHFGTVPDDVIRGEDPSRPRLGFFGAIDSRTDRDILIRLAEAHPEWDIFMLGPIDRTLFDIPDRPNLHFTGPIQYQQLPAWLHGWNVALMPWARNDLTEHINPTKTLEYLAARKPVVATAIPDLKQFYSDVLYLAEDSDQFIAGCEAALANEGEDEERLERGLQMARKASWDGVVGRMEELINEAIAHRER
ncbi:glycosyltransferase [bacterium]|nr:glycosyltransferase [bacterium]